MPQSLANFDAALKDTYGPGLRNAVNNVNPLVAQITKNTEDLQGRRAVWSVHTGRSTSTSSRAELAALATADRQRYQQLNEDLAYLYHTVKVSGQAKALTKGDEGSFTRALESEMKGGEKDLKNDYARQIVGQALTVNAVLRSGIIATASAYAANVFTLANEPSSVMRHFFVNEVIEVINGTTAASRGTAIVTAINKTAKTVTVDAGPAGSAAADVIVRSGNLNAEINGLRHLISSTSVFAGLDPATDPAWAALTAGSSTTTISELLFDQATEVVETDGDGETISLFLVEHAQRRKVASQLQTQKRYDGREVELKAGWKGLQIARGTLVVDRYVPTTDGFGINPDELVEFIGLDWSWDEDDGKVLYKALDGSDAVEARFKSYRNLVTTNRNSHVRITMQEPTF